ncbi:MAG: hypothetical protein AB7U79_08400 [Candidatus Izemoplasmatales bacterium]
MINKNKKILMMGLCSYLLTFILLFGTLWIRDKYQLEISMASSPWFTIIFVFGLLTFFLISTFLIFKSGYATVDNFTFKNPFDYQVRAISIELISAIIMAMISVFGIVYFIIEWSTLYLFLFIIILVVSIVAGKKEYNKFHQHSEFRNKYTHPSFHPKNIHDLLMRDIIQKKISKLLSLYAFKQGKIQYTISDDMKHITLQVETTQFNISLYFYKSYTIYTIILEKKLAAAIYTLYEQTHHRAFSLEDFDDDEHVVIPFDPSSEEDSYAQIAAFFDKKIKQVESLIETFRNYSKQKEPQ